MIPFDKSYEQSRGNYRNFLSPLLVAYVLFYRE